MAVAQDYRRMENPSRETESTDFSPERIAELAHLLTIRMNHALAEITQVNDRTHLLSLNARIEAARAGGETGAAFGVVASAIKDLSERTSVVAGKMARETQEAIGELERISKLLATNVRGVRLSDLALTNIELIDRNLYERSCDVRWWATDSSGVDALTEKTDEAFRFCSHRFGVILNAYTVYFDLALCDLNGRVVANGRPQSYRSQGMDCSQMPWFQAALATKNGDEFGFQTVHESPLVNGQRVLTYSCCVRTGGDANGEPLGVLGIQFNWDGLAQTIVQDTPLTPAEKQTTRVCIVDKDGLVLADTQGGQLKDRLPLSEFGGASQESKGFTLVRYDGQPCCIAHALSPGYETYATGWHALIIQSHAQK